MEKGFSLVELSIVLVILGLLTGGILTGQNLIRAAELRSVVTEFQSHQTALQTFRDKYFAIPGDMPNATGFWGVMSSGSCPNATGGTGTQTCNGDGNGNINIAGGSGALQSNEVFLFWQHLVNAGLTEGNYSGLAGSNSSYHATRDNIPSSKLGNAGWHIYNWNTVYSGSVMFDGVYRDNVFQFGTFAPDGSNYGVALTAQEAWNVDKKVDDGQPAHGLAHARFFNGCTDADDSADLDAGYLLTNTAVSCVLLFRNVF